jgi:hypothetical protein
MTANTARMVVGDAFVEEIAHRIDEDPPRLSPVERQLDALRAELPVEAPLVVMAGDAAPALGEALGVAVWVGLAGQGASLADRWSLTAQGHSHGVATDLQARRSP